MANTVAMVGISSAELPWMRMLAQLLRHPDPSVPELTRQALLYMNDAAARTSAPVRSKTTQEAMDFAG